MKNTDPFRGQFATLYGADPAKPKPRRPDLFAWIRIACAVLLASMGAYAVFVAIRAGMVP